MDFRIYDPSRGTIPPHIENSRLTSKKLPCAGGSDIEFYDRILCLIDHDNGGNFRIIDPDFPEKPLSELHGLGNLRQIEINSVRGRTIAAITARENGLWLIDITDKRSPFIACHYDSVEFATGVTFCGKYLFIGCRSYGVEIIDVTEPEKPRHVSVIRAGEVQSLKVANGILYTGSWGEREINVIDVSTPDSPIQLSKIAVDGRTDGIFVRENLLFAAFGQHLRPDPGYSPDEYGYGRGNGFAIYDISSPESPVKLSSTLFPHRYYCCEKDMWDISLSSHYAILSHTFNGVWIYDIAEPEKPVLVDYIGVTTDKRLDEMITMNDYIMSRRPPIIPFDPEKISYAPVYGVAVGEGRLWIAAEYSNLVESHGDYFLPENESVTKELIESGEGFYSPNSGDMPRNVRLIGNIGQVHAVTELCGKLYAACGNEGIKCFDSKLELLFTYRLEPYVCDIHSEKGRLIAAAGNGGIYILEPEVNGLKIIGHYSEPGMVCLNAIPTGRFIMAHANDQWLFIIDAVDPAKMRVSMREYYFPGLIYYRQMTETGASGRYYGCYWNGNYTHWYDLSGNEPIKLENTQGRLGFSTGVTGLYDRNKALAICGGGYVIHDIDCDLEYPGSDKVTIPGIYLKGKPNVVGNILAINDRIDGYVTICDISSPREPALLFRARFSGHPDLIHISGRRAYIPLGHQGIAAVEL